MRVCQFDGTETTLAVCPTCNDYKGFTTLEVALDDVFALMDEARQAHLESPCSNGDCDCREGEE